MITAGELDTFKASSGARVTRFGSRNNLAVNRSDVFCSEKCAKYQFGAADSSFRDNVARRRKKKFHSRFGSDSEGIPFSRWPADGV